MNSATINNLLKELKTGLQSLYGDRLHGIYLYGSCARGEAGRESDVDILVVLDNIPSYSAEVDRTSALIASLSLKHSVSVSRVFVSLHDWQRGQTPFLLNAREEAIAA
jgi:predicted nucleotidyltransferase